MNFHLKRHRKLSEVLPVPEGLPELMADIAREVLRYQPANIEGFIADYLEAMLLTRELYYVGERTVDDILNQSVHLQEMMKKTGVTISQSNDAIKLVIEAVKRNKKFVESKEGIRELNIVNRLIKELKFTVEQAKKASEIIENVWCHYYNQNQKYVLQYKSQITDDEAVQHTLSLHRRSDINLSVKSNLKLKDYFQSKKPIDDFHEKNSKAAWKNPNFQNREKAANLIQAWYKGAKVRKITGEIKSAAAKIQAGFKGYKTRKEMHGQLESLHIRNLAAKKIQSWYRACIIRKNQNLKINKFAVIIQAHYRGYLVRKKLKDSE